MFSLYDKLDDFILLGAAGDHDKLLIQQTNGTFSFKPNPSFTKDAGFESTCGALFDMDGDGDRKIRSFFRRKVCSRKLWSVTAKLSAQKQQRKLD